MKPSPTFALPKLTNHTHVDEEEAQRFVGRRGKRRRPIAGERVGLYLPDELVTELRVRAVRERRSVSDAVTEAVREWLGAKAVNISGE